MKHLINRFSPLHEALSRAFRSGSRWLAFDASNWRCFPDYHDAEDYCKAQQPETTSKILPLSFVTRILNKGSEHEPTDNDRAQIAATINRYPIKPIGPETTLIHGLARGTYCPILWLRTVNPLSHITRYSIAQDHPRAPRTLLSTDDFTTAISRLTDLVASKSRLPGELLLTGHGEPNIPLYRASPHLQQIHDPTTPFLIEYPTFARYHSPSHQLNFYNCRLQNTRPGTKLENIDLTYFAHET